MRNWGTVALRDIVEERGLVGGPFGSSLVQKDYRASGVPVIRGTNLNFGRELGGDFVFVSEEKTNSDLARNTACPGDLIFTQRGTLGQVALVPASGLERYVVSQSQMRLRPNPSIASTTYLFYACSSNNFLKQIDDNAISTGVPHINLGILSRLTVPLPDLKIQQAIAEVLGALDDKIAANTKLAATADEFIRASLLELNEHASTITTIGELASNRKQLVDPANMEPDAHYVGLEHIPRRSLWLDSVGSAGSVTSTKAGFHAGDVLFGKLRPYFHKVVSAPFHGVCSTDVLVLTPRIKDLAGFLLATVASDYVVERVTAASEGTRMPRTSWKDLSAVEVAWPGQDKAREFSASISPLRQAIEGLFQENQILAATRDALLPQLMSGKSRVKDAEAVVSAAV